MLIRSSAAAAAILAVGVAAAAAETEIGVAAAVFPEVTGTPPGETARTIEIGLDVKHEERVVTGEAGRTQMVFLDGSALTVGPDSDIVLDEFVYDPARGVGKLAFSATRGLFRFVGGKISKNDPVLFRTPSALVGVRGGIAIVEVGETTRAQFLFGERMTVEAAGVVREVGRPGFEVIVGPRAAPSAPRPLDGGMVAARLARLEGPAQAPSAAPSRRPMDANVAGRQLAGLGSRNPPQRMGPHGVGPGFGAPPPPPAPPMREPPRVLQESARLSAKDGANPPPPQP